MIEFKLTRREKAIRMVNRKATSGALLVVCEVCKAGKGRWCIGMYGQYEGLPTSVTHPQRRVAGKKLLGIL